jgi:hypothetical protein
MPFRAKPLLISQEEHDELRQITLSRSLPAGDVFRARLILMLAQGRSYSEIQERLETTAPTISLWKARFEKERIAGLTLIRHPGKKPTVITPKLQAKVLEGNSPEAGGWFYPLVLPQTGRASAHQQGRGSQNLANGRNPAA